MTKNILGPDPGRPLMMHRLRFGHEEPEIWNRLFPELKRNRECCDEVWFSTGIGFPKLEEHRRRSALMADHAKELRAIGIVPSLQFQATIGHGDFSTSEAGVEGKTWGSYVGIHGEQCQYVNCPRQPGFLDYIREMAKIYAQWHPGSVWIDDDLRLQNHKPASAPGGCGCPYCLSLFSQEQGRAYTREEIEAAYEQGGELKELWDAFGIRCLCTIAELIASTFREISPETRMGLQHCGHAVRTAIFEALKKGSGHRAGSRPGISIYSDHHPYDIITGGISASRQMNSQQGYETLGQVCPEIESYPRVFTSKTAQGYRIESLFYPAMGMDSLSYFMMDPRFDPQEWYGQELLAPLAAETPCYRAFIRHNEGSFPGGVGLPCPKMVRGIPVQAEKLGLPLIGIPCAGYAPTAAVLQITADDAELLPENDLAEALRHDVLLDGAAAEVVVRRGLASLIGGITCRKLERNAFEFYADDPFNAGLESDRNFNWVGGKYVFEVPEKCSCRILGRYQNSRGEDYGPATVLLERPDGTRAALIGYAGFDTKFLSLARVRFLGRIADWCAHGKLPAIPADPVQCALVPRIEPDGTLRSVTVLNVTIGRQKPFALILRNVPDGIAEAEWLVPAEKPVKIRLERASGECRAVLPEIGPWDIGWLKIPLS